jgi:hypothetical protein
MSRPTKGRRIKKKEKSVARWGIEMLCFTGRVYTQEGTYGCCACYLGGYFPPEVGETAGSTRIGYCELPTIYIRAGTLSFSYFPYLAYYPLFNFRRFIALLAWIFDNGEFSSDKSLVRSMVSLVASG